MTEKEPLENPYAEDEAKRFNFAVQVVMIIITIAQFVKDLVLAFRPKQ